MNGDVFVDANVLVYSRDASEPRKQVLADAWLHHLWETRRGRVSFQILHEFYVTVTQKLEPGLRKSAARRDVSALLTWRPIVLDEVVMENAWAVQDRYRLGWWDALVVAAAQVTGCISLLSEDFQDGQNLGGVRVIDPFAHAPDLVD